MKKFICVLLVLVCLVSAISCVDEGLMITKIFIVKYPVKIAYVMGRDTELDVSGCEILIETKDGGTRVSKLDEEREQFKIEEAIDFNKAGIYVVKIDRGQVQCDFAIEVIDPKVILDEYNLSNGDI